MSEATLDPPTLRERLDAVLPAVIGLAYVATEIFLFRVHEPWRDEAQSWLIGQDLHTLHDFLVIPGEGHPPLWYWLMRLLSPLLSFDQARLLMLGVVALNAGLLVQLLRDRVLLLVVVLCSEALLHYWGYYFRPYALIVSCVAGALLLERSGRSQAATWLLALSCGLHFYSGVLLAFWLLMQLRRGTPLVRLIGPAGLGAAFGLSAILSASGNPAGTMESDVLQRTLGSFAELFFIPWIGTIANAAFILAILVWGLRRSPFVLCCLVALLLLLASFASLFYDFAAWHVPFALVLVLLAWSFDRRAPTWPLVLLILPLDVAGVLRSRADIGALASPDELAYAAVEADAGARLDPPHNLVAWPDFLLTPAAARHNIRYLSGNNGTVIGAVDWRNRRTTVLDGRLLGSLPTPYWIVCSDCAPALAAIRADGRTATEILPVTTSLIEPVAAYRID